MEQRTPSYDAVIPAEIRYDDRLPMGAKMMYGEIRCLSNAKGFCWASNSYFAKLYNVTPQCISKWIKQLAKCGHVKVEYLTDEGQQQRRVSIAFERVSTTVEGINHSLGGYQPQLRGVSTTVKQNSTSKNSTSINKEKVEKEKVKKSQTIPPDPDEVKALFKEKGSTVLEAEKFFDFYESKGWYVGKTKMKKWRSAAANWIRRAVQNPPPGQPKPEPGVVCSSRYSHLEHLCIYKD